MDNSGYEINIPQSQINLYPSYNFSPITPAIIFLDIKKPLIVRVNHEILLKSKS